MRPQSLQTYIKKECGEKGQMAAAFRIFAQLGFADGASGHISLRGIQLLPHGT